MLTEVAIHAANPTSKPIKLSDDGGLYLLAKPNGARLWRLKYRVHGVEKLLAIGPYPDISLKRAREKRNEARRLLADGVDPMAQRKALKQVDTEKFKVVALDCLELNRKRYSLASVEKIEWMLPWPRLLWSTFRRSLITPSTPPYVGSDTTLTK